MMIEPDEDGNLTPSAPLGLPPLVLFTLDGPLALMPGPPLVPVDTLDAAAFAESVAVPPALEPAAFEAVAFEPVAPPSSVGTAYGRPHRARSAVELLLISIVLGTVLAAAVGLAAAVLVAVVNHAVNSSSTAP